MKELIFDLINTNYKLVKLGKKIVNYVESNILNLQDELYNLIYKNTNRGISAKNYENNLNSKIKIKKKIIEKDKKELKKIKGYAQYTLAENDRPGILDVNESTGLDGAKDEFDINLNQLIELYQNESCEIKKMLIKTIKSFRKLENKSKEYIEYAKNVKYKEETLNIFDLENNFRSQINTIKDLKINIKNLKNKILDRIKKFQDKHKAKKFKIKLKNLTKKLENYYCETISIFEKKAKKCAENISHNKINKKDKFFNRMLSANATIRKVEFRKRTLNYLIKIFKEYKNL